MALEIRNRVSVCFNDAYACLATTPGWLTFAPHHIPLTRDSSTTPTSQQSQISCTGAGEAKPPAARGQKPAGAAGAEAASALASSTPSPLAELMLLPLHLRVQLLFNLTSWAVHPTALSISKTGCHCICDSSPIQKPIYITWRQINKVFGRVNATSCPRYWIALTGFINPPQTHNTTAYE